MTGNPYPKIVRTRPWDFPSGSSLDSSPNQFLGEASTDSTIAPPSESAVFLNERCVAAGQRDAVMKKISSCIICPCLQRKDCRTMTSRWQGAPYFRRYGPGAGFKTGDLVKEQSRGGILERLPQAPNLINLRKIAAHLNRRKRQNR